MDTPIDQVFAAGKARQRVRARSLLCYIALRQCGMTMVSLSNRLGISQMAVSQSVKRGAKIAFDSFSFKNFFGVLLNFSISGNIFYYIVF